MVPTVSTTAGMRLKQTQSHIETRRAAHGQSLSRPSTHPKYLLLGSGGLEALLRA